MQNSTDKAIKTKPQVLIVDDDVSQLKVISDILLVEELQPICFTNAKDAIEECKKSKIDVSIIDLSLTDMEGLELLKQLKQINPDIKVIINTGFASLESAMEAVNEEAFAYITKMGNVEELLAHVHRAFHCHLTRYNEELAREVSKKTAELQRLNMELEYEIAERKKIKEELLKARKLESLGVLAGGIAHDFNNLLTAILGNISLVKLYLKDNEQAQDRMIEAENASLKARELTHQLLTFAKGGSPVKKNANIKDLIRDSTTLVLRGSSIVCEFHFDKDLYCVKIDQGQIIQVINNITINSKQSMPDGGLIKVSAKNILNGNQHDASLSKNKYVCIVIEDRGIGIPEGYLMKIFDPYYTTKEDRHGLGLATCYSIIKKHDGIVTVESEVGKGSIFRVYLPASEEVEHKDEINNEDVDYYGKGRVLIMDDEEGIREVVSAMLKKIGYSVKAVTNGNEAIINYIEAIERSEPFDIVILDLTIRGGKGGRETLKELYNFDPEVKAIVASGCSNDPVMAEYEQYGFRGRVAEPFKTSELNDVLKKVLAN